MYEKLLERTVFSKSAPIGMLPLGGGPASFREHLGL